MSEGVSGIVQDLRDLASDAFALNEVKKLKLETTDAHKVSDDELLGWNVAFNRRIRAAYQTDDPVLGGIYERHRLEFMLGLLVAKNQMHGDFMGTEAKTGIGAVWGFESGFWGQTGTDGSWESNFITTADAAQNWIHGGVSAGQSGTGAGAAGSDLILGESQVNVIVAYGLYALDRPNTQKIQERINTAPQPFVDFQHQVINENSLRPVKVIELDTPRFLVQDSRFRVQAHAVQTVPASEFMFPIGVAYTKSNILQTFDLAAQTWANLDTLNLIRPG